LNSSRLIVSLSKEKELLKKKISELQTNIPKFHELRETKEKASYMDGLINELLANIEVQEYL
jgi:hypothetical protein